LARFPSSSARCDARVRRPLHSSGGGVRWRWSIPR
jgi:hypothetical protein